MADVKIITEFFLLSLTLGLWGFTAFINPKLTGSGFIKLISSLCIGTTFMGLALNFWRSSLTLPMSGFYLGTLFLLTWQYFNSKEGRSFLGWVFYALLTSLLVVQTYIFHQYDFKVFSFFMSSSLLLGSIVFAMVLGHWYLVVPKLSELPLVRLTQLTWLILFIKLIVAGFFINSHREFFELGTSKGAGYSFNWMILTMRILWGYVVVLIMSFFSYRLVKMRSTQSATGVLYAMTFFILAGELVSSYLYFQYGMFI